MKTNQSFILFFGICVCLFSSYSAFSQGFQNISISIDSVSVLGLDDDAGLENESSWKISIDPNQENTAGVLVTERTIHIPDATENISDFQIFPARMEITRDQNCQAPASLDLYQRNRTCNTDFRFDFSAFEKDGNNLCEAEAGDDYVFTRSVTLNVADVASGEGLWLIGEAGDRTRPNRTNVGVTDGNEAFWDVFLRVRRVPLESPQAPLALANPVSLCSGDNGFIRIESATSLDDKYRIYRNGLSEDNLVTGDDAVSVNNLNDKLIGVGPVNETTNFIVVQEIECASSLGAIATVLVSPIPETPMGSPNQTFCSGSVVADLQGENVSDWYSTATPVAGEVALPLNRVLSTGTYYAQNDVVLGDNSVCSSERLGVNVTVVPRPTLPMFLAEGDTLQRFCRATNPTVGALRLGGGAVRWYDAATGGNRINLNTPLVDGEVYYFTGISMVNGVVCQSTEREKIQVSIIDVVSPAVNSNQTFCSGSVVANLQGENVSGWYSTAIPAAGEVALPLNTVLSTGTYYAQNDGALGDNSVCSSERLQVSVTVVPRPALPMFLAEGDTLQRFCRATSPTVDALRLGGGTARWYDAATGGNRINLNTPLVDGGVYYFAGISMANGVVCQSTERGKIQVSIIDVVSPAVNSNQTFCSGSVVADLQGENVSGWYSTATPVAGEVALPLNTVLSTGTYYAQNDGALGDNGVCSSERLQVSVTVVPRPSVPSARFADTVQRFCVGAKVSDLEVSGTNIKWYDAASGGNVSTTNTPILNGARYYAESVNIQESISCASSNRLLVVTAITNPVNPVVSSPVSVCIGADARLLVTSLAGTLNLYDAFFELKTTKSLTEVGSRAFVIPTVKNPAIYYVSHSLMSGCESDRIPVFVDTLPRPVIRGSQDISIVQGRTAQLEATGGIDYVWMPSIGLNSSNIPNPTASRLAPGTYTYIVKGIDRNNCTNLDTVVLTVKKGARLGTAQQSFSPNGDGINDNLVFPGLLDAYPEATVSIYNRWGDAVWQSDGPYLNDFEGFAKFEGLFTGQELPNGTYFYVINLNISSSERVAGEIDTRSGFIELRR